MDIHETAASGRERLELSAEVAGQPDDVWRAFTDADALTGWWAQEATTDPVVGGVIEARWPSMEWVMRGRYTELDPGRVIAFTWSWDHEPDTPERRVRVTIAPTDTGSHLTLTHGDYGPDDAEERQAHLDGWRHFLPRLDDALELEG